MASEPCKQKTQEKLSDVQNGQANNNLLDEIFNEIFNIDNHLTMIKIGNDLEKIYFAKEIGKIFKEEKQIMVELQNKKKEREKKKKIKEIVLFFNHNNNIIPITFKQYNYLYEVISRYKEETNNKNSNLKFIFKGNEFTNDDLKLCLYQIKGMVTGEEIIAIG